MIHAGQGVHVYVKMHICVLKVRVEMVVVVEVFLKEGHLSYI